MADTRASGEHSESCGYAMYGWPALCTCGADPSVNEYDCGCPWPGLFTCPHDGPPGGRGPGGER